MSILISNLLENLFGLSRTLMIKNLKNPNQYETSGLTPQLMPPLFENIHENYMFNFNDYPVLAQNWQKNQSQISEQIIFHKYEADISKDELSGLFSRSTKHHHRMTFSDKTLAPPMLWCIYKPFFFFILLTIFLMLTYNSTVV